MARRYDAKIPIVEWHRGVGIHDNQPRERIEQVVKPEIDHVLALGENVDALFGYCGDVTKSPEARLLAAALIEATFDLCVSERRERPNIDLPRVRAHTAGLDSERARSRRHYASLFDVWGPGHPGAAKREHLLEEHDRYTRSR